MSAAEERDKRRAAFRRLAEAERRAQRERDRFAAIAMALWVCAVVYTLWEAVR